MPPTYSPWLKAFEALGRLGMRRRRGPVDKALGVGRADQGLDVAGGGEGARVASGRDLFLAWSPPTASDWFAYARPTLFAALDAVRGPAFPVAPAGLDVAQAPRRVPSPVPKGRAVLLDLPGPHSVAMAAYLARAAGHQPVVLFNNWPHSRGVVDATSVLGALLYFLPWVTRGRQVHGAAGPPVFVMDRDRMGHRRPVPRDFDNRYYHLDADLPSAATFARHGIDGLLYVRPVGWRHVGADPSRAAPVESDDLNGVLHHLGKRMVLQWSEVTQEGWGWREEEPLEVRPRKTPYSTVKDPRFRGFKRSAAGGFGRLVPEPSSGGG